MDKNPSRGRSSGGTRASGTGSRFRLAMRSFAVAALCLLTLAGAVPSYLFAMPGRSHRGPLPALSPEQKDLAASLRSHVEAIAAAEHNVAHYRQLEQAAHYIETALARYGFQVARQEFGSRAAPVRNLEVSVSGAGPQSGGQPRLIVVGAHYDSAPGAPGANDNASGCAAVIELARLLRNARLADDVEIRFVLFVNEEAPYFGTDEMGSLVHARALRAQGRRVDAMLSLETIGYFSDEKGSQRYPRPLHLLYPDAGNFIGFVGDTGARALVRRVIASFRKHAPFPSEGIAAPAAIPGIDWSDHWAYRQAGYPAMMITDTALYRYPHYHTAQDTPDKLDYERMARVVTGLEQVLRELAS